MSEMLGLLRVIAGKPVIDGDKWAGAVSNFLQKDSANAARF